MFSSFNYSEGKRRLTTQRSDPAHEGVRWQPRREGRARQRLVSEPTAAAAEQ